MIKKHIKAVTALVAIKYSMNNKVNHTQFLHLLMDSPVAAQHYILGIFTNTREGNRE